MAEEQQDQEKTEEPTERKLEKARSEGQVARSRELNTMAMLMSGSAALLVFGGSMGSTWMRLMQEINNHIASSREDMVNVLPLALKAGLAATAPVILVVFVFAIISSGALGGFLISAKAIAFKGERMSPVKGFKRMFSSRSLVELVKGIAKVVLVAGIATAVLDIMTPDLLSIGSEPLRRGIAHGVSVVGWSFFLLSLSMVVIAGIDVPFQLAQFKKQLKMTKQEVKDEHKEAEGNPEVKSRIRQTQQEIARRRMLNDVPEADVVITNPEHYSVAIRYDAAAMAAPVVVAKGVDLMAFRIREIANVHKVPVVRSPLLSRAIYFSTEIGMDIPAGLYVAVAQILAYVYQLSAYRKGQGDKPDEPQIDDVPAEFRTE